MKNILILAIGCIGASLFATSPMPQYAQSVSEIRAVLEDKAVQKKMLGYTEFVTSIKRDVLRDGKEGWVVSNAKCALEVAVNYTHMPGRIDPRFPGGHKTKRTIVVGDCR